MSEAEEKRVLVAGTLFEELIALKAAADSTAYQITWGNPMTTMVTYHEPTIAKKPFIASPPPDPLDTRKRKAQ